MKRIVGFSGGADSQATALWVRQRFPVEEIILLNSDAGGNEHPMTTEFISNYSKAVFPVVMIEAQVRDLTRRQDGQLGELSAVKELELNPTDLLTFDLMAKIKGRFPSTKARFCTEHLKLRPQRRWMLENKDGLLADGYERYIGVRADVTFITIRQ